jgi:single-stranded DNA-binding protein
MEVSGLFPIKRSGFVKTIPLAGCLKNVCSKKEDQMNHVELSGTILRLKDKTTTSGKRVLNFTLKCSEKLPSGQRDIYPAIVLWEPRIELRDGLSVLVMGRLETRSYEDKKTSEKKYVTEVIARECHLLQEVPEEAEAAPLPKKKLGEDFSTEHDVSW